MLSLLMGPDIFLRDLRRLAFVFWCNHCFSLLQLEVKKSKNEAECEALRVQIRELWDRLQIPEEEKEPVAAFMTGSKAKVRNAVRQPMGVG